MSKEILTKSKTFELGVVSLVKNMSVYARHASKPFLLTFYSENHCGWGITKEISEDEAEAMTDDTAERFYFEGLELLGIRHGS